MVSKYEEAFAEVLASTMSRLRFYLSSENQSLKTLVLYPCVPPPPVFVGVLLNKFVLKVSFNEVFKEFFLLW